MNYLLRSMLFVPSYNEKFIRKAIKSEADAIILDLEDSCPVDKEDEGRRLIRWNLCNGMFNRRQVFIRVNELGTRSLEKDLNLLDCPDILGVMPSKINSPEEMRAFDALVAEKEQFFGLRSGSIKLAPLIETAGAVVDIDAIVEASERIIALTFGGEDYLDSVCGIHTQPPIAFNVPRAMIVLSARKHGIIPIDTPYLDVKNETGFRIEEKISACMGFAGILLVNPTQIPWANDIFSPSVEEITYAHRVVAAVEKTEKMGTSIAMLDGKMIGPPMRKRAEKVVTLAKMIESKPER